MPKVTIYTQAYNPGEFLKPCIESVLNQTYTDFEWLLVDHGSTDGTSTVIDDYAEKDSRIIPIHIAVNGSVPNLFYKTIKKRGTGKYLTYLDSDDWWDLDYLEHLVPFAEENGLDLALTGAVNYFQDQGVSENLRQINEPAVMTLDEFAKDFPKVGPFIGALWANLRPMEKVLAQKGDPKDAELSKKKLVWRLDTLYMLNYADHCQKIGINEFAPYHYRKYSGSLSGKYTDTCFESNIFFYRRLEDFFQRHGVLDEKMEVYLRELYFYDMLSSVNLLESTAALSANEKLGVCAEIVTHPLTVQALPCDCAAQRRWRAYILNIVAEGFFNRQSLDLDVLQSILRLLAPDCSSVLTDRGAALFARERDLLPLLFKNNRQALMKRFLELIEKEEAPEQFDLGAMLQSVLPENSPLRAVEDVRFFKHYPELTQLVLGSGHLAALDRMTALLLEERPLESKESFLQLYLTLAALENQVSAFVFGKVRLAKCYQAQRRREDCRTALRDLEEMGAGDLPEVAALRESCEREGSP